MAFNFQNFGCPDAKKSLRPLRDLLYSISTGLKPNMSNQDFNAVPIATPSKPGDIKDIESQSLLGADREWGSEAAMEKILRRGFLKKVRHCAILFISMFVLNGFFHCSLVF